MRNSITLANLYQPSGWYANASKCVVKLASITGHSIERTARVISILSPRVSVRRNLVASIALLSGLERPSGVMRAPWDRAQRDILRGPKTTAFARNLLGDESAVTLDTWAWRALGIEEYPARKAIWEAGRRRYHKAAERLGVTPAECQAGVWQTFRGGNVTFGSCLRSIGADSKGIISEVARACI